MMNENSNKINIQDNLINIICANCGEKGHYHKSCDKPITSLGIILFTKNKTSNSSSNITSNSTSNSTSNTKNEELKFLMIRRKDTIGYVEFIRGRYNKYNIETISNFISEMTKDEIEKIQTKTFDELWKELWMEKTMSESLLKKFEVAKKKFNDLKNGYLVNGYYYNLNKIIKNNALYWNEPEWGFPKGRRNSNETNIEAALREFTEETGYKSNEIVLYKYPIFSEMFIGSDNLKYRHLYYIAELKKNKDEPKLNKDNKNQLLEISDIGFFSLKECVDSKIRFYLNEKKRIIQKVYNYIKDNTI
jgi:ADP-ribose pyrophosphatase YjhB (NUDIX family)